MQSNQKSSDGFRHFCLASGLKVYFWFENFKFHVKLWHHKNNNWKINIFDEKFHQYWKKSHTLVFPECKFGFKAAEIIRSSHKFVVMTLTVITSFHLIKAHFVVNEASAVASIKELNMTGLVLLKHELIWYLTLPRRTKFLKKVGKKDQRQHFHHKSTRE